MSLLHPVLLDWLIVVLPLSHNVTTLTRKDEGNKIRPGNCNCLLFYSDSRATFTPKPPSHACNTGILPFTIAAKEYNSVMQLTKTRYHQSHTRKNVWMAHCFSTLRECKIFLLH